MSYSILRRYTPPTCTLEIMANSSPLSRWMGQTVLKDLRFRLKLDDPKVTAEQWTQIQGDRTQLEALRETVQSYVQNLLDHSQSRLDEAFEPTAKSPISLVAPTPDLVTQRTGIALQPQGLLAHNLTLGTLATPESGESIALSTLQLFDLANALDEYATDVVTLPDLQRSASWVQTSPAWLQVAAVSLVAIGLTASVAKLFDGSTRQTASAPTSASSSDQRIANQLPPELLAKASPLLPSAMPPLLGSPVPTGNVGKPPTLPSLTVGQAGAPAAKVGQPGPTGQPGVMMQPGGGPGNQVASAPSRPQVIISSADIGAAQSSERSPKPAAPTAPPAAVTTNSQLNPDALARESDAAMRGDNNNMALSGAVAPTTSRVRDAMKNAAALAPIPQTNELQLYFQKRWKPIAGVTQPLQYDLELAAAGEILSATPIGRAAQDNVEKSTIPLNEIIVDPLANGKTATIRLVLNPDGTVQTFLRNVGP